jgi:polar amino acid transport system substrate-binding protein
MHFNGCLCRKPLLACIFTLKTGATWAAWQLNRGRLPKGFVMKQVNKGCRWAAIAAIPVIAVLAAACSSGSSSSSSASGAGSTASATASGTASATASVALPAAFKGKTLVSPVVNGYPPYAYQSGGNTVGIDPDLSKALAGPFGQPISIQVVSFEDSLLGVQKGSFFMVTGADITAAREKTFDMVPYLADHYEFASLATKPALGTSVTDLCGLTISTVAADSSIPILNSDSSTCTSAGKKAITVTTFPDQGSAVLAVESGRADATTATVTNLGYLNTTQPGKFRLGGPSYDFVYIGLAAEKGNGMGQALAAGINALIADGTYAAILQKYGVEADAITHATVNPNPTVSH